MNQPGPELNSLTHRLAECPSEFYETPLGPRTRKIPVAVDVRAIFSDHLRDLDADPAQFDSQIQSIESCGARNKRMVLIAIWLLHDPWLMKHGNAATVSQFLQHGLTELAEVVMPEKTITDPDRRAG